eukprot:12075659-Prorocentrum_lima.AAC.1
MRHWKHCPNSSKRTCPCHEIGKGKSFGCAINTSTVVQAILRHVHVGRRPYHEGVKDNARRAGGARKIVIWA